MSLTVSDPVRLLHGVGAVGERELAQAGIATIGQLLWHLPFRWEDRARLFAIADLPDAGEVTVRAEVIRIHDRRAQTRGMHLTEASVADATARLAVVWFNQPYLARLLQPGMQLWLHGRVARPDASRAAQMLAPEYEIADDTDPVHHGRIVPIYERIGRLGPRRLRGIIAAALADLVDPTDALDALPLARLGLPGIGEALRTVHAPGGDGEGGAVLTALAERRTPAQRRLIVEEFLALCAALERSREERFHQRAAACAVDEGIRARARALLPFRLTSAQRRVVAEIVADLQGPRPMARLLQGDVGSGKTVVAALAALVALENGLQVAFLAPTELLAQQHAGTLRRLFASTKFQAELLVGSLSPAMKRDLSRRLRVGECRFVVGTHALLEPGVKFGRLGLVIVDEQHKFGVMQRQVLRDKGDASHLLIMTATPIPRSVALGLYGDLDLSLLDEAPPGRTPVRTVLRDGTARARLLAFVRREVAAGGQVYWVFPVIEEQPEMPVRALDEQVGEIAAELAGVSVAMVHGRQKAAEREGTMAAFARGEIDVLCATTVIEVGVDVANATVMVIENPERFGLSQLHQLRGRVGRGRRRALCVLLVGTAVTAAARARIEVFAATNDGFRLAEEDFRLRGPGDLAGLRQWGRARMRIADLGRDRVEFEFARHAAATARAAGRLDELTALLVVPGLTGEVGSG